MTVATSNSTMSAVQAMRHEEALRRARKRVKDMRAWYMSASMYALIIPTLWAFNLFMGGKIWAHWATIGWGIGLTAHGLSVFAGRSFFGSEWEEKKVEEIMVREKLKVVSGEKQLMQAAIRSAARKRK